MERSGRYKQVVLQARQLVVGETLADLSAGWRMRDRLIQTIVFRGFQSIV